MVDSPDAPAPSVPGLPGALPGTIQSILGRARVVITPYPFGVSDADNLRIVAVNSAPGITIEIHGRQAAAGLESTPFRYVHTPASNRTPTTEDFTLGAGLVTNLSVFAAGGSPLIGQTFVIMQLIRSMGSVGYVMGTLLSGYVTSTQGLGWPGSAIQSSIEGGGYIRTILGTQPAVGTEVVEVVPAGARWEVMAFTTALQCSGAAGTRLPRFASKVGAAYAIFSPSSLTPIAGALSYHSFSEGVALSAAISGVVGIGGLPVNNCLLAGQSLQTDTGGLQAGDQWSAPCMTVREWLEAA